MEKAITAEEVLAVIEESDERVLSTTEITEACQERSDSDGPVQRTVFRRLSDLKEDGKIESKEYKVLTLWWAKGSGE